MQAVELNQESILSCPELPIAFFSILYYNVEYKI
jgi:hypothetical protein